ncbi:hypothetical protein FGG08_007345 [Glutinoglossum americanum]|uniref:Amidoligase enzyme n=1 Tax=Glutinoglossum americanum TaxID=1670608 RepID=A0A9P8HZN2_9PEZI|nr:hypothetical protein FGG08_007345 [Glutinoglossum americanum]
MSGGSEERQDYNIVAGWKYVRWGFELEFISQVPVPPDSSGDYPYTFVTQALNEGTSELRFKFNDGKTTERFDYARAWTLTPDETVKPDPTSDLPDKVMTGMELVSPTMPTTLPVMEKLRENDLPYIHEQLTPEKIPGCRFWVNSSCGMHVHVSIRDFGTRNFEFLTIQNLIAFWGVYEKEIERLHPEHRRHPRNIYAASLRSAAPHDPKDTDLRVAQWLFRVYSCKNFSDLRDLTDGSAGRGDARDSKVNIVAYSPRDTDTIRPLREPTIEFREHAGTLDPKDIFCWIMFVTRVVRFAVFLTIRNCRFSIKNAANCDIGDIFNALDFGGKVWRRYWEQIYGKIDETLEAALKRKGIEYDELIQSQDITAAQSMATAYATMMESAVESVEEGDDWRHFHDLAKTIMTGLGIEGQDVTTREKQMVNLLDISRGRHDIWEYVRNGMFMAWLSQQRHY